MPSISINNLRFFDKSGSDISPIKTDNVWTSSISIPEISVGLHEVAHIFIGEDVINTSNIITRNANTILFSPLVTFTDGTTKNVKPSMWIKGTNIPEGSTIQSIKNQTQIFIDSDLGALGIGSTTLEMHPKRYELTYPRTNNSSKIRARLEQSSEIFYLFDVAYEETLPIINKVDSFIFELDNGNTDLEIFNHRQILASEIRKELIQINIAASAKFEGEYTSILLIEEIDTDGTVTILSRISLVFQAIGEDERFKSMLENFGRSIDSKEYIAFRNTDIKEDKVNYQELNNKRKEMLVAGSEIWPYLGSYKGLVNALKYFGYGDLRLKEYWLNVDQNSKNEGKMITMNVPLSLDYTDKEFDQYKRFINGIAPNQPSKVFRKTAKFGLFYDLNRDTGEFDEDGLPITEDVFEFTNEEILIKLFSLKNILKEKFLPLNARIIDITGEGVYYDNIGINSWNIPTPTFHIDVEKELAFEANPKVGFLEDLSSQFTSNCDLYVSTKLSEKANQEVIDYSYCIIDEDVDESGIPLVGKHPRYARKIGFQTTITNLTDDYVWNDLTMTWEEAGEKTWENLKYQDYQTMRWIVKSVDRGVVIYDKTASIGELDVITVTLPYLGFYDVTLELVDHFNFHHRQTKKNLIEVRPKEADIAAIFRSHEMYETWEEIEDTESDLAIGDMHGTWMDITINEDTTWTEVGDLTWEAVDWFTYSNQDKLFTYFDGEFVNQNSEEVANVIGFNPSKQEVRVKGLNNSRFLNNKRQSAYFFKDRTKSDVLLLDIVANAAGNPLSMREYNNNDVQFINAKEGFIVGDLGKFIYTKDGGKNWDILNSDTVSNLNALSFVSASNGWIVGDYGVFLKYTQTISGIPKISVSFPTPGKNLYDVHFINEDIGYIAGDSVVWKTVDGGTVWANIAPNSFTEIVNKIYFPTTTLGIFVTRSGKIYRTTDGGENWDIVLNVNYSITSLHFFDNLYGWASYSDGFNHTFLKTTDGGITWVSRNFPMPLSSIRFINRQIGFASGLFTSPSKIGVIFKTQDGGKSWFILTTNTTDVVNKIYPVDSQLIYAVGLEGAILKTSSGGMGADKWVSQTANQKDGFPLGSEFNVWITEAYNGTVFQYEQAILVIKHTPRNLTWTGPNSLITKWTVGSTQPALDAKLIFFDTPNGRKQYSITSSKFTITNEVEYTIDQYIEDISILNNGFIVQSLEAIEINNKPRNELGGLRIDWVNTWTNDTVFVLDNMMIMLRLESKDMYCNILDMRFEDDETVISLDWRCDIIKKLDPDYFVAIKPYNIEEANTKMGTINRTWGSFCTDVTWEDMSNKTWNDFEFNGLSYCSFTISQVKRGGVIIVDDKHFFQFPPEEIKQVEGKLIEGDSYVDLDGLIAIKSNFVGSPSTDFKELGIYWVLSETGDGLNLGNGFAAKLMYTGNNYNNNYRIFRVLNKYSTTELGNGIIENDNITLGVIFDEMDVVLTSNSKKKYFTKECDINNSSIIKSCNTYIDSPNIVTSSILNLQVGMIVSGSGIPIGSKILKIFESSTESVLITTESNQIITERYNTLKINQNISGTGIPSGTHIVKIDGNVVTMSKNATITGNQNLTFSSIIILNNNSTLDNQNVSLTFEYDTIITSITTDDLEEGMLVIGTGIPSQTKIKSIIDSTSFSIDNISNITGSNISLTFEMYDTDAPSIELVNQTPVEDLLYPNMQNIEIDMLVYGDGIPQGTSITYIDGVNPYTPNRILLSNPATKSGSILISFSRANLTNFEAINYLNNSNIEGIKDFYYSVPLLEDGVTYANYILAKAKLPGVSALHYFEFLYGVESDWEDDPSHTHSYPLGIMKEWTKSEEDGGQPLGINNPPLWNYLYSTYHEFGEWFPVPELLGEYSTDIQDTRALYVQALDGTFNWQDTKIKRWKAKVNPGTTIFMNSFPSKIAGVTNHKWRLYDNLDTLLAEIDNEFLVWTFCDIGNYTVELEVSDIENNKYTVTRNGFIEVSRPKKDNHYLPGLGWTPPELPELPPVIPPPYQEPNDGILKYYETFWVISGTNDDQKNGTLIICNWESNEIRRAASRAKEFFLEYVNPDNTVSIIKYDITEGTDASDLGNLNNYDATDPNFNFLENLNKNFNGAFNNPTKWYISPSENDYRLIDMQNNITLRPDNRKRPGGKIYFIANSTSNM